MADTPEYRRVACEYKVVPVTYGRNFAPVKPTKPKMDWSVKSKIILPSRGKGLKNSALHGSIGTRAGKRKNAPFSERSALPLDVHNFVEHHFFRRRAQFRHVRRPREAVVGFVGRRVEHH